MKLDTLLDSEEQGTQKVDPRTLKRLARYVFAHKGLCLAGVGGITVGAVATLLEPRLFGLAIDEAIVPRNTSRLREFAILFLGLECARVAALISQGYLFEKLGQRVMQDLRIELFAHLQALPVAIFDKNPAGRLVTRVTNDVSSLAEMFSAGFITIALNAMIVVGTFATLLWMDLKLGLIAAATLPPLILASMLFSAKLRVAYRDQRSKLSALNAFLAENILGMRVVHLFNRSALHLKRFNRVNEWYAESQIDSVRLYAYFQPTITWCSGISVALLLYYGGVAALEGSLKVGMLVAFYTYALAMFQPVREIADKWNIFLSGMASAERVFSILDWKPEMAAVGESDIALPLEGIRGEIRFEDVWFAYQGEHWVLKDFNLHIQPGHRVGVVGHTGAGKTTLISLLLRFYEPQRGRILLDGKDLREYDKRRLRSTLGIIQQDVFLFSGSVMENVHLWREPVDGKGGEEVAALLEGMAPSRPVELLERGGNLSMGERQVLAFARALAQHPSIWILDEATSNVDSESERKLEVWLERATRGKTSILIAHRLATVRSADQILVLHRGQIVEQGTHSKLIELNGLYARLYRYQSAVESVEAEPGLNP